MLPECLHCPANKLVIKERHTIHYERLAPPTLSGVTVRREMTRHSYTAFKPLPVERSLMRLALFWVLQMHHKYHPTELLLCDSHK